MSERAPKRQETAQETPEQKKKRERRAKLGSRAMKLAAGLAVGALAIPAGKSVESFVHTQDRLGGPKDEAIEQITQVKHAKLELDRLKAVADGRGGVRIEELSPKLASNGYPYTQYSKHRVVRAPDALLLPEGVSPEEKKEIEQLSSPAPEKLVEAIHKISRDLGEIDASRIVVPPADIDEHDGGRVLNSKDSFDRYELLAGLVEDVSSEALPGQEVKTDNLARSANSALARFNKASDSATDAHVATVAKRQVYREFNSAMQVFQPNPSSVSTAIYVGK